MKIKVKFDMDKKLYDGLKVYMKENNIETIGPKIEELIRTLLIKNNTEERADILQHIK